MAHVPGLRSPYAKVGRLVYFGRMLDKLRLQAAGRLPADYQENLGKGFDGRCCSFLGVNHAEVAARVAAGGTDEQVLAWCHERGGPRTNEQCEVWNGFLSKRGWRDEAAAILARRIAESGLPAAGILTMFDFLDADEGRDPAATRAAG